MLDNYPETLIGVEWHSPSFTPGNSDFDISAYSTRANLYGVGGIPHTQWNGEYETVGGYPNGDWESMIGTFETLYDAMVDDETPYDISINGYAGTTVTYDVTISLDSDMSSSNQKVNVFVVEDNIWSYWAGASAYHNARNVARLWPMSEDLSISIAGESETFSGTFEMGSNWIADSTKIIAIVQNYSTKHILQASQVFINDMNPDIDGDGVMNGDDNCIEIWNPLQEDEDNDQIGDYCDPCNNLVYILGNINGDTDDSGGPIIDIFDILKLTDYLFTGNSTICQESVLNFNEQGPVNVLDVIALVQFVLNENN